MLTGSSAGQNSCNETSLTRRSFSGTQRPRRQSRWVGIVRVAVPLSQAACWHVSSFERFSPKDWSTLFAVAEAFLHRYTVVNTIILKLSTNNYSHFTYFVSSKVYQQPWQWIIKICLNKCWIHFVSYCISQPIYLFKCSGLNFLGVIVHNTGYSKWKENHSALTAVISK